jgi:hypothetical protein
MLLTYIYYEINAPENNSTKSLLQAVYVIDKKIGVDNDF